MSVQDPQEMLAVLGKSHSIAILEAASEPRSAQELSDELDLPMATCYRRVEELAEQGLLSTGTESRTRTVTVYQRTVDTVCADLTEPASVRPEENSTVRSAIDSVWQRVT